MSSVYISAALQAQVLEDAGHRCGYCHSDERLTGMALSVEHLLPRASGGATGRENLWRSCRACNEQKGAQAQAADPETGAMVPLYNPRLQPWNAHFHHSFPYNGGTGATAAGMVSWVSGWSRWPVPLAGPIGRSHWPVPVPVPV